MCVQIADIVSAWSLLFSKFVVNQVDGLELIPLTQASDAPVVVHGTYFEAWKEIQKEVI